MLDLKLPTPSRDMPLEHDLTTQEVWWLNGETEQFLASDEDYWRERARHVEFLKSPAAQKIGRFKLD